MEHGVWIVNLLVNLVLMEVHVFFYYYYFHEYLIQYILYTYFLGDSCLNDEHLDTTCK